MRHFVEVMISHPLKCSTEEIDICKRKSIIFPENMIAYRFFDTDDKNIFGENYSGWTYFGEEYSFMKVCKLFKRAQELLPLEPEEENIFEEEEEVSMVSDFQYLEFMRKNMSRYGWERAVKACDGHWYPLMAEDRVISSVKGGAET